MTAAVYQLPGAQPAPSEPRTLNLTTEELVETSGGYVRPADQLKALHGLGFTRAWRRTKGGPVILERAHYDAVTRGQFGMTAAANEPTPQKVAPNRAGYREQFGPGKRGA